MKKQNMLLYISLALLALGFKLPSQEALNDPLLVHKCADFEITGSGENAAWTKTEWTALAQLGSNVPGYDTRFKILYSPKGIYMLFDGKDRKITTTYDQDFEDLFKADVFEVFFHPDPSVPLYFEYEINQLNKELVLIIPNFGKTFMGWTPWHYDGDRKIKKMVHVEGGKSEAGASITSWSAELFIPFELLATLPKGTPESGAIWNANFYRLDYDTNKMIKWAWSPIEQSFHEYKKYGSIRFE